MLLQINFCWYNSFYAIIKMLISNLLHTTHFWYNFHQVREITYFGIKSLMCKRFILWYSAFVKSLRVHDRMVIYNYLWKQGLSPLTLWVRILLRWGVLDTTLCHEYCHWLAADRWFSSGPPVSSTIKTDRHDITEILFIVALNTISPCAFVTGSFCFRCLIVSL